MLLSNLVLRDPQFKEREFSGDVAYEEHKVCVWPGAKWREGCVYVYLCVCVYWYMCVYLYACV